MDILVNSTIINILSCTQDQHLHFSRHDGRLIMHRTLTQTLRSCMEKLDKEIKPPREAFAIFCRD
jgi:hypothetical protein